MKSHRIASRSLILALGLALLSCTRAPSPEAEPPPPAEAAPPEAAPGSELPPAIAKLLPADAGAPRLAAVKNLARLPTLGDRHRTLLGDNGFFIAPQSRPAPGQNTAEARESRRAKHLFQVYERNDYIRFPSYVTADLAIDLTHQYFDVVLRRVERDHLVPRMKTALQAFVKQADALGKAARGTSEKQAARAAAVYWGTLLRLLEEPAKGDAADEIVVRLPYEGDDPDLDPTPVPGRAPVVLTKLPADIERDVAALVAKVHRASTREKVGAWGIEIDFTQTKPRGHYADDGVLQRYFRAMSLLGMTSLPVQGEDARTDLIAALALTYAGDPAARRAYDDVLRITAFAVGEPATAGLAKAHEAMGPRATTLAAALKAEAHAEIVAAWAKLPAHPVQNAGPVVQPMGQRVFLDTLGMSKMLPILRDLPPDRTDLVARSMGAAGAAAILGSDEAKAIVVAGDDALAPELAAAIDEGRTTLAAHEARGDAYHRTIDALLPLLSADPLHYRPAAYRTRMLQSFAGGWAMLRHDTLLYAYQMGAECDAEDLPAPYGWVEPVPKVYTGLADMVGAFSTKLREAGISEPARSEDDFDGSINYATIDDKTKAVLDFLQRMQGWAEQELRGEPFTKEQRTEIAMVGGFAEHVVLTLADAFELGDGNDDMAIIADVFTFQGRALEVGVGHPDLVYAIVPTPEGWVVARGAVLAYRELFVEVADRMTDEAWRTRLEASADFEAGSRPEWLAEILAPPVGVVELPEAMDAQHRCEYYGGSYEL
jgi:hypothetical protein